VTGVQTCALPILFNGMIKGNLKKIITGVKVGTIIKG